MSRKLKTDELQRLNAEVLADVQSQYDGTNKGAMKELMRVVRKTVAAKIINTRTK
jgi:hypothetical protein